MNNSISIAPNSLPTSASMIQHLKVLDAQIDKHAAKYINQAFGYGFTSSERWALIAFQKLKLIQGLGDREIFLYCKVLDEIERFELWSVLPGGYSTLDAALMAQGISASKDDWCLLSGEHSLTGNTICFSRDPV
jgi:hypothetical protein